MSVSNLNEFPLEEISTTMSTIRFSLLIMCLIKFLLVQILLHRKRISHFFTALRSPSLDSHDKPSPAKADAVDDGVSTTAFSGEELEMVLRSLGICAQEKLQQLEILEMFEEREPSLSEVREAFDVFDENRDGFIDAKEVQRVVCALGCKEGLEMENCRRMIGVFDEDGDGRIDFHEFLKLMETPFA